MAKGFSTNRIACFIAGRSALGAALPTWRAALALPEDSLPLDPFTGERTRDPDPTAEAMEPEQLPFEHVALPGLADWEPHYLALDLALHDEPGLAPEAWDDSRVWVARMTERGLMESPFFGGEPDECGWIHVVPARLVHKLAELGDDQLGVAHERWKTLSPLGAKGPRLTALRALAQKALATQQEMFLWLIHTMYR
ncbi:Hypothetical protein A7982_01807 [Minicystis rosea]|nr:Hypothetical protein A7982_01807 [Minicystis rosea]